MADTRVLDARRSTSQDEQLAQRDAWAVLGSIDGIGPATLVGLVGKAGGAARLVDVAATAGPRALEALLRDAGRPSQEAIDPNDVAVSRAIEGDLLDRICVAARGREELLRRLDHLGIGVLTLEDEAYPERLRATDTPPAVLFVRGDVRALAAPRTVAIVGTRRPTETGRFTAARIAGAVARTGGVVVSGLAVGIDGAAHAAAVAESAPTVAVLGGGHGRLFPRAHLRLSDLVVAEGGAIVAEVGPDVEPTRWSFPRRNRVISGLSEATVVVEAPAKSGALITAGCALEQGRGCFVVPGPVEAPTSVGCLALLREYPSVVRVVAGIPELLEDLDLVPMSSGRGEGGRRRATATLSGSGLGRVETAVAAALVAGATTVDEMIGAVREPVATILGALTLLEMRGLVVAAYGRYRPAGKLASGGLRSTRRRIRVVPDDTAGRGQDQPPI